MLYLRRKRKKKEFFECILIFIGIFSFAFIVLFCCIPLDESLLLFYAFFIPLLEKFWKYFLLLLSFALNDIQKHIYTHAHIPISKWFLLFLRSSPYWLQIFVAVNGWMIKEIRFEIIHCLHCLKAHDIYVCKCQQWWMFA